MFFLHEFHTQAKQLADLLLWAGFIHGETPCVMVTKTGALTATMKYRGQDVGMLSHQQRLVYLSHINRLVRRIGSGWAVLTDEWHLPATYYAQKKWTNGAAACIDASRRVQFTEGNHYEGDYYLTLLWQPQSSYKHRWYDGFFTTPDLAGPREEDDRNLAQFVTALERFSDALALIMPEMGWLDRHETASYLAQGVSLAPQKIACPEIPFYLDAQLTSARFVPGNTPRLGEYFLRPICIKTWPRELGIYIPEALQAVDFPYRFTVRSLQLDQDEAYALLSHYQRKWEQQLFDWGKIILSLVMNIFKSQTEPQEPQKPNPFADTNAKSLEAAKATLAEVSYGYLTPTILVWGRTKEELAARERAIIKIMQAEECLVVPETVNAAMAFLGMQVGDVYHNVRQPALPSSAYTCLMPHHAVWTGQKWDAHLQAPALFQASSNGAPFWFGMHVGELGSVKIVGPSRTGKTGLISFMASQFQGYDRPQLFGFDKDYGLYCATMMHGGTHYDWGRDTLGVQPLGRIAESAHERRWAQEWVEDVFEAQHLEVLPEEKEEIWTALGRVAALPPHLRTISAFRDLLQVHRLKPGLSAFVHGGRYGFFDAAQDSFTLATWTVFEMSRLLELSGALPHMLSYIFHRIDERLDGRPTLIIIEEFRSLMQNLRMLLKTLDWIKTKAKLNLSVALVFQEIIDAKDTLLWQAIQATIKTGVFLPNSAALNPEVRVMYEAEGFSKEEIALLPQMQAHQDYMYRAEIPASGKGGAVVNGGRATRIFQLRLTPVERLLCAASRPEEIAALRELVQKPLSEPLPAAWLRVNGLEDEADLYRTHYGPLFHAKDYAHE